MQRKLFFVFLFVMIPGLEGFFLSSESREAPDVRFLAEHLYFSPDGDGIQDGIVFHIKDRSHALPSVMNWKLEIRNSRGQIVHLILSDHRDIRDDRKFSNFFLPGPQDLRGVVLPETLYWDGRHNSGKYVEDGSYTAELTVTSRNLRSGSLKRSLELVADQKIPLVQLKTLRSFIQKKDETYVERRSQIVIGQAVENADESEVQSYSSEILDAKLEPVYRKESKRLESLFVWDGKDDDGDFVEHGIYRYRLTVIKKSGVAGTAIGEPIYVTDQDVRLALRSDRMSFSPDGNGNGDQIQFTIDPIAEQKTYYKDWNKRLGVKSWELHIDRDPQSSNPRMKWFGEGAFPDSFTWNGRDTKGLLLDEDLYFGRVFLETEYGLIETTPLPFRLDLTPPAICSDFEKTVFTPDDDLTNDNNGIDLCGFDPSGIDSWKYQIYLQNPFSSEDRDQLKIRTFQGSTIPQEAILWDGKLQDGSELYSSESMKGVYIGIDGAGNQSFVENDHTRTGILFRPLQKSSRRLVVVIPDGGFFDKKTDELNGKGKSHLDRFLSRYRSHYSTYALILEYHTSKTGAEKENLLRSEKRARKIFDYIRGRVDEKTNIRYRGEGETSPLNQKLDSQYKAGLLELRNERIEIHLEPVESP